MRGKNLVAILEKLSLSNEKYILTCFFFLFNQEILKFGMGVLIF